MGVQTGKKNKKRAPKRGGKKQWRNLDVSEYIDRDRLAKTSNNELFVISKAKKGGIQEKALTRASQKAKIKNKVLHEDAILTSENFDKRKVDPLKNNSDIIRKLAKNIKKEEQKLNSPSTTTPKKSSKEERKGFFDIWEIPKEDLVKITKVKEEAPKPKVFSSQLVNEIHSGASYRPTEEDHEKIIKDALNQIEKKQNKEDKYINQLHYDSKLRDPNYYSMNVQFNFGDDDNNDDSKMEDESEEAKREREIKKKYSMKFTQTQLNKKRRLRIALAMRKRMLTLRRRMMDIDRIPQIMQAIEKVDSEIEEKRLRRIQKEEKKKEEPDRLGKYPFSEKPIDFLYSDQLPSNLRSLKATGNVAVDIYKGLQKRNILEPRVIVKKRERRYRLKSIQKRDAKNWDHEFKL